MNEIWKDVKGFEGIYQVSNLGRIKGLKRISKDHRYLPERILSGSLYSNGYIVVKLRYNGMLKRTSIHRLVAEHFIPNPNKYPCINHKDENKRNNKVENLEWCSQKYNSNYGTGNQRRRKTYKKKYSKKIRQYTLNGDFVREYDSIADASFYSGAQKSEICSCCKRVKNCISAKGYLWRYADESNEKSIEKYSIKKSPLIQPIIQYSLNGDFIMEFESISDAVKSTGTRRSGIYACCVGRYKSSNGYVWKHKK